MTQVRLTNYESSVGTGVKVINKEQTSYTISTTDLEGCNHLIVQCKGISGNMTVNLPPESDYENKMITVLMIDHEDAEVHVKDSGGTQFMTFGYYGDYCEVVSNGSTRLNIGSEETSGGGGRG